MFGGLKATGVVADPLVVVIVMVTVAVSWFSDGGLKLQELAAGRPVQANVTAPMPLLESTVKSMEAELPLVIVSVLALLFDAICSGGPMWVGSLAVLLPVFTSPPPETAAEFVMLAWIFCGTFTVSVIAG
jgi:hypothetical protein